MFYSIYIIINLQSTTIGTPIFDFPVAKSFNPSAPTEYEQIGDQLQFPPKVYYEYIEQKEPKDPFTDGSYSTSPETGIGINSEQSQHQYLQEQQIYAQPFSQYQMKQAETKNFSASNAWPDVAQMQHAATPHTPFIYSYMGSQAYMPIDQYSPVPLLASPSISSTHQPYLSQGKPHRLEAFSEGLSSMEQSPTEYTNSIPPYYEHELPPQSTSDYGIQLLPQSGSYHSTEQRYFSHAGPAIGTTIEATTVPSAYNSVIPPPVANWNNPYSPSYMDSGANSGQRPVSLPPPVPYESAKSTQNNSIGTTTTKKKSDNDFMHGEQRCYFHPELCATFDDFNYFHFTSVPILIGEDEEMEEWLNARYLFWSL